MLKYHIDRLDDVSVKRNNMIRLASIHSLSRGGIISQVSIGQDVTR